MSVLNKRVSSPFENDNARNSTPEDLPSQFVWTESFTRLLSPKNHILIGARGSGKTAIVKMLSHDYLTKLDNAEAKRIIKDRSFIGVYVPMRLSWVGGLKNKPWTSEAAKEKHFQWRLNIACCAAFLNTLESCLGEYCKDEVERILKEKYISLDISAAWFSTIRCDSLRTLREGLAEVEYERLLDEEKLRANNGGNSHLGVEFDLGLFEPVRRAIGLMKKRIVFPAFSVWAICLDEAEYLSLEYQRILNSYMRTYADGLVFKITTMPYKHYTLATNTEVPLVRGDDFDYVYIDGVERTKRKDEYEVLRKFCESLFLRRIKNTAWERAGVTLEMLLGNSFILNDKSVDRSEVVGLIKRHANEKTINRALYLEGSPKFDDEIGRKLKGALLLRDSASKLKGNASSTIYSGAEMVIRCSDGNPRRFIELLNALYLAGESESGFKPISETVQDRILKGFSSNEYRRIISEPEYGFGIHELLFKIGAYFKDGLHHKPLSTDLILSFRYSPGDEQVWKILSEAIGLGLVKPLVEKSKHERFPLREGVFRLSYMLSPHFMLLPRRGKDVSLNSILYPGSSQRTEQLELL